MTFSSQNINNCCEHIIKYNNDKDNNIIHQVKIKLYVVSFFYDSSPPPHTHALAYTDRFYCINKLWNLGAESSSSEPRRLSNCKSTRCSDGETAIINHSTLSLGRFLQLPRYRLEMNSF